VRVTGCSQQRDPYRPSGSSCGCRSRRSIGGACSTAGLVGQTMRTCEELEKENHRLKLMVADQLLEIAAREEIGRGNW
jgi:hypothetical protein